MAQITEGANTPWGEVQEAFHLGAGVYIVATPGHGGLYVPDDVRKDMPPEVADIVLKEQGWTTNWAEEDCSLPIAMAFIHPRLDNDKVARTFPSQSHGETDPHTFWKQIGLQTAQQYRSLNGCVPFLQDLLAQAQPAS